MWTSVIVDEYPADLLTVEQWQKKMMLEKFQDEVLFNLLLL